MLVAIDSYSLLQLLHSSLDYLHQQTQLHCYRLDKGRQQFFHREPEITFVRWRVGWLLSDITSKKDSIKRLKKF